MKLKRLQLFILGIVLAIISVTITVLLVFGNPESSNQVVAINKTSSSFAHIAFNPDGTKLAASNSKGLYLWDVQGSSLTSLKVLGTAETGWALDWSRDGQWVATSGTQKNQLDIWQVGTNQLVQTINTSLEWVQGVHFNKDGTLILIAGQLFQRNNGQLIKDFGGPDCYEALFNADESQVICFNGSSIYVRQITDGSLIKTLKVDYGCSYKTLLSPDRKFLLCAGGSIELWNLNAGTRSYNIDPEALANTVAFSPDGQTFAIGRGADDSSSDKQKQAAKAIEICRTSDGTVIKRLVGHKGGVISVAFSPDGKMLASSGVDGTLRLWPLN